jgi:hypothetical protein
MRSRLVKCPLPSMVEDMYYLLYKYELDEKMRALITTTVVGLLSPHT